MIWLWPIRHSFPSFPEHHKKEKGHDAGNAKTILNQTFNFSLLTQSSGREDRLCPPRPIQGKLEGGGRRRRKRNVKILPSFCHALRTGLVNCCQIKKQKEKQPWSPYVKKHFLSQPSRESPHRQNYTVTFKGFAFKRWRTGLNAGRFLVTIETLEKVENSVRWTLNDFIKVSLIRRERHKVLVFGQIYRKLKKSLMTC